MRPRFTFPFAAAVAGLLAASSASAKADFRVCNQTLNLLNLAVGYWVPESELYQTEGWWTLAANSCVSLIKKPLAVQYVYVYGTDIYGDEVISGSDPMCVSDTRFAIHDQKDCWVQGYETVQFHEVNTENALTWTMFVRDR